MMEPMMAYIDPASGSLLMQLLLGSIVGMGLFFRQHLSRVFRLFRRG